MKSQVTKLLLTIPIGIASFEQVANFVVVVCEADCECGGTTAVFANQQVGVVVGIVVVAGTVRSTGEVAVLVVGVGKLFVTTYPGFGVDAVEVVVNVSGGAVVAVCG